MRLQRLTGLEREKIESEYQELQKTIQRLKAILADEQKFEQSCGMKFVRLKRRYGDARRTQIEWMSAISKRKI